MTRRELLAVPFVAAAAADSRRKLDERAWDAAHDKLNIRHSPRMHADRTEAFLKVPEAYAEARDFDVARTPPEIDFGLVQGLEPEYLSDISTPRSEGAYGGWGDVSRGPDGCFYFSIGNHMSYDGGTAYIIRYDPGSRSQSIVVDTKKLFGWGADDYADGKLHGDFDFAPNGDMWAITYFGPVPKPEDWHTSYHGGSLFRYNAFTKEIEKFGIIFEGDSWPYHNWDWQRHLFFAIGHRGNVLVYDTKEKTILYGGWPPDGIRWFNRAILIDRESGLIYSTDTSKEPEYKDRLVRYQRRNNHFARMNARIPNHPVTGKSGALRAHTERKDERGAFWCFDMAGTFFRFYPAEDKTELVGLNWGHSGKYTTNISMSPKGRYLYYLPGADRRAYQYGTPVVQYDTKANRKKVIAFIYDHYLDKYGYAALGTYGLELDEKGESLFFFMDGRFTTRENNQTGARRPSMFSVHIPASERAE
jgi:hypothetical protein